MMEEKVKKAKLILSEVVGNKRQIEGTIMVQVTSHSMNSKYKKSIKRIKKYSVDCAKNSSFNIGDKVSIKSCAPKSKTKHMEYVCHV
jgi:ribosomal protein S17